MISNNIKSLAKSINKFTLDLYEKMKGTEGNVFLSPYSAIVALAMTYAGARGNTEKEMKEVLHFDLDKRYIHPAFEMLTRALQAESDQIKVANALWIQENYRLSESFIDIIEQNYSKMLFEVNFEEAEDTRKQINDWVKNETNEKIVDLIQQGVINAITRLILTNAIHFKSDWSEKFKEKDTNDAPFKLMTGKEIVVPLMHQKTNFGYLETDQFQALEIPYAGYDYSMVVFLPKENNGLVAFEDILIEDDLEYWLSELDSRRVEVYLPKFKLEAGVDLAKILQELGMTTAFSTGKADFSGITQNPELCISAVVHKTFLNVNEEGTEAAAATAVVMLLRGLPMEEKLPVFRVDHPFMFLIRHNKTGTILFIGRIMEP